MSLATLNNATILNAVKGKINNTVQCMLRDVSFSRLKTKLLVYNLTVAVGAETINGKFLWHTRNQTILWAANHPVAGNNCTCIKIAENFTFSAACSFGPILALCQTQ
jgi:hypothetical protein